MHDFSADFDEDRARASKFAAHAALLLRFLLLLLLTGGHRSAGEGGEGTLGACEQVRVQMADWRSPILPGLRKSLYKSEHDVKSLYKT